MSIEYSKMRRKETDGRSQVNTPKNIVEFAICSRHFYPVLIWRTAWSKVLERRGWTTPPTPVLDGHEVASLRANTPSPPRCDTSG
ncbi:hypothetical protein GJAV_G00119400 [Gymnothorax javanicus]|nr:hypothetical protein GJAV_G00119400 [Gymnothorax javanicus]